MADVKFGGYTFVNPEISPYIDDKFNGTWLTIEARELQEETAYMGDDSGGLKVGDEIIMSWRFLAPQQIQENVIHEWAPWETISSRIAGMGKEFVQVIENVHSVGQSLSKGINNMNVGAGYKALSQVKKVKTKVDTPLVYENSQRMEWTMTFNLISAKNGYIDIIAPIRQLQMKSSPTKLKSHGLTGTDIELPHIFSIRTESPQNQYQGDKGYDSMRGMIDIDHTALTSIQPTYMAPYDKNGQPTRCELTLTFKQLPPLYSDSFPIGGGGEDPGPVI